MKKRREEVGSHARGEAMIGKERYSDQMEAYYGRSDVDAERRGRGKESREDEGGGGGK